MSRCAVLTKLHCSESAGQAEQESALGPKKTEERLREGEREGQKRTEEALRDSHLPSEGTGK